MFKALKAIRDTYITDRVIDGEAQLGANVGAAASLDLYKLYGYSTHSVSGSSVPNTELTRLLLQFDLGPLQQLVSQGLIDTNNASFSCRLRLYDVYGGQPNPQNFTVSVFPLSGSFDEGNGRDVVLYGDVDAANWLTSSYASGSWIASGCGASGSFGSACDYYTDVTGSSMKGSQFFVTGEEDLDVDVTNSVRLMLSGGFNSGFRVSLDAPLEVDQRTYFVKRFASRTAYNGDLHPRLLVRFDDSVQDDTDNVFLDSTSYLFLYNYVRSAPANLTSGSSAVTGSNSVVLQLTTPVSGGTYSLLFTGSQHRYGTVPAVGIYSASVTIPMADPNLVPLWRASGSVMFTPVWQSLDGTVAYLTGSAIKASLPQRGPSTLDPRRLTIGIVGLHEEHRHDESTVLRVNAFDYTSPIVTVVRVPVELPGIVIRDVHYQVRDNESQTTVIPFDTATNSTRVSNDASGMYFRLDMSNLTPGHSYVIDVLVVTGNNRQLYLAASPVFRVSETQ